MIWQLRDWSMSVLESHRIISWYVLYTVIQGVVYDLAATGLEYVGIGISHRIISWYVIYKYFNARGSI